MLGPRRRLIKQDIDFCDEVRHLIMAQEIKDRNRQLDNDDPGLFLRRCVVVGTDVPIR